MATAEYIFFDHEGNASRIERAIDKAVDIAYPVFHLFGWTWVEGIAWVAGIPSRDRIRSEYERMIELAVRDLDASTDSPLMIYRMGRLVVEVNQTDNDLYEIHLGLDISYECIDNQ